MVAGCGASAAETLLTCAADLDVLDLVPLAGSALHLGDCTMADLVAVSSARRRGVRRLRSVLPLLDGRSESAWESLLRRGGEIVAAADATLGRPWHPGASPPGATS